MMRVLGVVVACLVPLWAHAQQTRYVTDNLRIQVRTGQGNDYRILRSIESGTRLDVLQEPGETHTQVRLPDGTSGWVLSRYLVDEPIARDRLARAEKELARLSAENAELKSEKNSLSGEKATLEAQLGQQEQQRERAQQELAKLADLAARPREVEAKNAVLRTRIAKLESEASRLHEQNQNLKTGSDRTWFLAGAGVLFVGLLLGLVAPRLRWRRRSSWDTF